MIDLTQVGVGLFFSTLIGGLGFMRGSLSISGWAGAVIVGTALWGFGGPLWGVLIILFFISSSLLSKVGKAAKQQVNSQIWEKSDTRDWWQVMANGGLPTLAALGYLVMPSDYWWAMAIGAIAAATADTWATEIGVLNPKPPVHLLTRHVLEQGMSGGVSRRGTLGSIAGAVFIGMFAFLWLRFNPVYAAWPSLLVALVGGIAGSSIDSLLGATIQEQRWCSTCQRITEQTTHHCGTRTVQRSGWHIFNNDVVNWTSILLASGLSAIVWGFIT